MSDESRKGQGPGAGQPGTGLFYIKQSEPRTSSNGRSSLLPGIIDMLGALSVTSQFKVSLHLVKYPNGPDGLITHLDKVNVLKTQADITSYDFFCSDASLPGASFDSSQESGSRQGVIENFPTKRIYPPFEITFYVDSEYKIIRVFEEWMNFINPLYSYDGEAVANESGYGNYKNRPDFFRMRYPDEYKRIISITKFERDFYEDGKDKLKNIPTITYRMIDAYPDQINSIPLMYEGSIVTKTTVRFLYSRYVIEHNRGNRAK